MSVFTYDARVPFDPATVASCLTGCLLCGRSPVAMVSVYIPDTDEMRAAVLRLRVHPVPPSGTLATSYALCVRHSIYPDVDGIEAAILEASRQVRVQ